MKFGIRKRSYAKSFKAMTTGRLKRAVKRQVVPLYGVKGAGWIKNPKKAAYNAVYSKTTVKSPLPYLNSPLNSMPRKGDVVVPHNSPSIDHSVRDIPETIASSSRSLVVSSSNFEQLKQNLTAVYENRTQLRRELSMAKVEYYIKFIFTSKEKHHVRREAIKQLEDAIDHAYLELTFRKDMRDAGSWDESSFYLQELMQHCQKIWDLTSRQNIDRVHERTIADERLDRKLINSRQQRTLEFIKSDVDNLYLPNLNGADLYIYPTFIVEFKNYKKFSIHDLSSVSASFTATSFQEEQGVPKDSDIIGQTYKYTNKNGAPDRRFKNNYTIPVVRYGDLAFQSNSGINDRYQFSNFDKFMDFAKAFARYAQANLEIPIQP